MSESKKCTCGKYADYNCADCETPICDSCNHGTIQDEKCLCSDCKGILNNSYQEYMSEKYNQIENAILAIKEKGKNYRGENYQYVRAVYNELQKYHFDITTYPNVNKTKLNNGIISEIVSVIQKKQSNLYYTKKTFGIISIQRQNKKIKIDPKDFSSLLGSFFS